MADTEQQGMGEPLRHTLRLALAMRGGVSLAVWIGGAVAEIDVLRRTAPVDSKHSRWVRPKPVPEPPANDRTQPERMDVYEDLLHLAAYDGVEVDILAGASAGGLNAVIYGAAQSLGVTIDHLDGLWSRLGGMWRLMRTPTQFARASSVLQGDQYFYEQVYRQLQELADGSGRSAAHGVNVTIDLAATLLADADGGRPLGSRAQFHFVGRDAALSSEFNDLPRREPGVRGNLEDEAHVEQSLKRLALAARSTSSFPGAFEPSAIYSNKGVRDREEDGVDARAGLGDTKLPVMWGHFSAARPMTGDYGKEPFYVVDGGVFDNIPVDRALRAIELAPATHQTSRRLLYLDPDPPAGPTRQPGNRAGTDWLPVILRARRLQRRTESAGDELQLVRDHNDRVAERQSRYDDLAAALQSDGSAASIASNTGAYVRFRAARDTTAFGRLLTEPTRVLVGRHVTAETRPPMSNEQALHLAGGVEALYEADDVRDTLTGDVRALIDTATLLISWIRALQLSSGLEVLAHEKGLLYRVLFTANMLRQESDAAILAHTWETSPGDDEDIRAAINASRTYLDATYDRQQFERAFAVDTEDRDFYTALGALRAESEDLLMDALWRVTARAHASIRVQQVEEPRHPVPPIYLVLAGLDDGRFPVKSLHWLFVPAGGVPGTAAEVGYHEITGGQSSPLEQRFATLRRLEARVQLTRLLKGKDLPADISLFTSHSKLAGNTLANFGGFLSHEWRLNDWRWGRLDAAAALVDIVTANAPDSLFDERADDGDLWNTYAVATGDREALKLAMQARLQELLLESQAGSADAVEGYTRSLRAGGQTLADLRPSYKLGLASRGVHLVHRSLWPAEFSVGTVATAMGLTVLRPVAVLAPLLLQPVRAAAAVMLTMLVASMLTTAEAGPGPTRFAAWAAIGAGTYLLASAWLLGSTWSRVVDDAGPVRKVLGDFEKSGRSFARRRVAMFVSGSILLVGGAVVIIRGGLGLAGSQLNWPGALALATAVLAVAVATKRSTVTVFATEHARDPKEVVGWVLTVAMLVGAVAAGYLDEWRRPEEQLFGDGPKYWQALLLAFVVAVLTFLVLAGWAESSKARFYAGLSALLAGLVLSALVEAWEYGALGIAALVIGIVTVVAAVRWGPKYKTFGLIYWGSGLGVVLIAVGFALCWPSDVREQTVSSGPLALGLVGLGTLVTLLGLTAGKKWDFQVFGVATGIEIVLAGVWMLLAQPSSGVTDTRLLWWAYGAWFLVMSLATLYIPNKVDEPPTERPLR